MCDTVVFLTLFSFSFSLVWLLGVVVRCFSILYFGCRGN